jgi:Uncharacterized NAD(FAD)-dependent dehydrogenases
LTVAAHLVNAIDPSRIALIEPSAHHFYQPLWTLVGGGVFPKEESMRQEADYIPAGVTWIQEYVTAFDPDQNQVVLKNGDAVTYDYLVAALGIQIDWDRVKGLREALAERNGVCSNYSYETVDRTWDNIRLFRRGVAVFTQPSTPIKCGGAPQKIAYLADDHFRRAGVRNKSTIKFYSGTGRHLLGQKICRRPLCRMPPQRDRNALPARAGRDRSSPGRKRFSRIWRAAITP